MEAVKDFYTVNELSEALDVLPDSLRRYIRAGQLKAAKINGSYIIDKEEAERFIKARGKN